MVKFQSNKNLFEKNKMELKHDILKLQKIATIDENHIKPLH